MRKIDAYLVRQHTSRRTPMTARSFFSRRQHFLSDIHTMRLQTWRRSRSADCLLSQPKPFVPVICAFLVFLHVGRQAHWKVQRLDGLARYVRARVPRVGFWE